MDESKNNCCEIPESLSQFRSKMNDKFEGASTHNIYLLQSVDKDGNVTDEKYGMNVMTNAGMYNVFVNNYNFNHFDIILGTGTGTPSITDTRMFEPLRKNIVAVNRKMNNWLPAEYDPITRDFIGTLKVAQHYYDYNLDGVTEDIELSEIGMYMYNNFNLNYIDSYDIDAHSLIYDSEGNQTTITKKCNERLYITVYMMASVNVSVFEDTYDQGIFFIMSPQDLLYNTNERKYRLAYSNGMISTDGSYGYKLGMHSVSDFSDTTMYSFRYSNVGSNNYRFLTSQHTGWLMEDKFLSCSLVAMTIDNENNYWRHFTIRYYKYGVKCEGTGGNWCRFISYELLQLPEPEELTCDIYTDSFDTSFFKYFNKLGNYLCNTSNHFHPTRQLLPVENFCISSVYLYNHLTKEWDIPVDWVHDDDWGYTDTSNIYCEQYMRDNNGTAMWCQVWCNNDTTTPVIKFNIPNYKYIWCTNTFWDSTSWIPIEKTDGQFIVPEEYQHMKYYIRNPTSGERSPFYAIRRDDSNTDYFIHQPKEIINIDATVSSYGSFYIGGGTFDQSTLNPFKDICASSDTDGWVIMGNKLFYPESVNPDGEPYEYTLNLYDKKYNYYYLYNIHSTDKSIILEPFTHDEYTSNTARPLRQIHILTPSPNPEEPPKWNTFTLPSLKSTTSSFWTSWRDSIFISVNDHYLSAWDRSFGKTMIFDIDQVQDYSDGEDIPPIMSFDTNGSSFSTLIKFTDNIVYKLSGTTFRICNIITGDLVEEFTLPTDYTYTVNGIYGYKELIYISVTYASKNAVLIYSTMTKAFTYVDTQHPVFNVRYGYGRTRTFETEEFIIFTDDSFNSSDNSILYGAKLIKYSNPTKIINLTTRYTDCTGTYTINGFNDIYTAQIKETHQGKHLFLLAKCYFTTINPNAKKEVSGVEDSQYIYNRRMMLIDMGRILDEDKFTELTWDDRQDHAYHFLGNGRTTIGVLYKDRYLYKTTTDNCIYSVDPECSLPHRMTGTTTTIQCWNNPRKVYGHQYECFITNDLSKKNIND